MASRFQLNSQLTKVVNLSIVAQDVTAIGRQHWLMRSRAQVDDGQTAMADPEDAVNEMALAVGASMANSVRHGLQNERRRGSAIKIKEARDPAHRLSS